MPIETDRKEHRQQEDSSPKSVHVGEGYECPQCGEARLSALISMDDEQMYCTTCGLIYRARLNRAA